MSLKHVERYYKQICDQYNEMLSDIEEIEKEASEGLVEPERIDRLKDQIAPIKQNYERWAYMMYLLHQPNKKRKISKYKKQHMSTIAGLQQNNSLEAILEENETAMKVIGE